MVETAAHLVEHLFPQVPVRQWVITLPKRLRYYLLQDAELAGRVLQAGLRVIAPAIPGSREISTSLHVIERTLREQCPDAPPAARYGGVTYIHRFGSALNAHLHYHSCMIDGLFTQTEEGLQFYRTTGLSGEVIQQAQKKIRKRVLSLFVRHGLLSPDESIPIYKWP